MFIGIDPFTSHRTFSETVLWPQRRGWQRRQHWLYWCSQCFSTASIMVNLAVLSTPMLRIYGFHYNFVMVRRVHFQTKLRVTILKLGSRCRKKVIGFKGRGRFLKTHHLSVLLLQSNFFQCLPRAGFTHTVTPSIFRLFSLSETKPFALLLGLSVIARM